MALARLRASLLAAILAGEPFVARFQRACGVKPDGPTNPVLHALFHAGAALGNELFFIAALPIMFWELNSTTGRVVLTAWGIQQYVGQVMKDVLQLPRPRRTRIVRQLESHYATEFGLPSTHAANAVSMPWLLVWLSGGTAGVAGAARAAAATCWTLSCTLSRFYMGVHTVADVVVGLALGAAFLAAFAARGAAWDATLMAHPWTPVALPAAVALAMATYPRPRTPAWVSSPGDTATMLGSMAGALLGQYALARVAPAVFAAGAALPAAARAFPLPPALAAAAARHSPAAAAAVAAAALAVRVAVGFSLMLATRAVVSAAVRAALVAALPPATVDADAAIDEDEADVSDDEGGDAAVPTGAGGQGAVTAKGTAASGPLRQRRVMPSAPAGAAGGDARPTLDVAAAAGGGGVTAATALASQPSSTSSTTASPTPSDEEEREAAAARGGEQSRGVPHRQPQHLQQARGQAPRPPSAAPAPAAPAGGRVPLPPTKRYAVALPTKLLTYAAVGVNATFTVPLLRHALVAWWSDVAAAAAAAEGLPALE